jgi:hypothetical protein
VLSDDKYYGIYRGLVADNNDPDGLGRVKLVIPQILGQAVTTWAWPVGGNITQSKWPYGTFYTNADQSVEVNTATVVTNWVEADTSRAYLDGTKLYVEETGDYFLQFSTMFTKTNASTGTADMWIRKNGTNIADSNTRITLSGSNAEITMTVGLILDLDAGDYIQLVASASSTNTFISRSPAGVGPAVPGVVATLNLVGKWKPQPNTGVWVMFEGGDPHFPVWFGGF